MALRRLAASGFARLRWLHACRYATSEADTGTAGESAKPKRGVSKNHAFRHTSRPSLWHIWSTRNKKGKEDDGRSLWGG